MGGKGANLFFNVLEVLSRDQALASAFDLDTFRKPLKNFLDGWIKKNEQILRRDFPQFQLSFQSERFTEALVPCVAVCYLLDGSPVPCLHSCSPIATIGVILTRLQRFFHSTETPLLTPGHINNQLRHCRLQSDVALTLIRQDAGSFQTWNAIGILFVEELLLS